MRVCCRRPRWGQEGGGSSMGCAFTRSEPVPDVSLAGYYNGSANGTDVRLVLHEDGNVSVSAG